MDASLESQLDPARRSSESREFEAGLRRKIVRQDEAVQAVVDLYQVFRAGLASPGRPVGNLLFLGPTGAGKTRDVEATAEVLFGDPRAVIKVDCAEFRQGILRLADAALYRAKELGRNRTELAWPEDSVVRATDFQDMVKQKSTTR